MSFNPYDVVMTRPETAKVMLDFLSPNGSILEPCKGSGNIYNLLPTNSLWCELQEGRDFFDFNEKVDWIITNPPYSKYLEFLQHSFEIANNVGFLVPVAKVFVSNKSLHFIKNYGGIVKVKFLSASKAGFPFGFALGVFHFKRDYKEKTEFNYDSLPIPSTRRNKIHLRGLS